MDQLIALLSAVSAVASAFFGNKINKGTKERSDKLEVLISEEALLIDRKINAISLAHIRGNKELRSEIELIRLNLEQLARSSKDNRELIEKLEDHLKEAIGKHIHTEFAPIRSQTEWINDFMVKVKASKVVGK